MRESQLTGNFCASSDPEYRNGWLIRTTTKSFAVYAATSTEKQEWMAHINKCIEDLLRKSGYTYAVFFMRTNNFLSCGQKFIHFAFSHSKQMRRRQETSWAPCCRLGARQRGKHLHALQAHSIHNAPEKGKPTRSNVPQSQLPVLQFITFFFD